MSKNVVKAVCCVFNCDDGSCCKTDRCPNPVGGGGVVGGEKENGEGCETETYQEYVCTEDPVECEEVCFYNKRGQYKCNNHCSGGGTQCGWVTRQRCKQPPPCVPSCGAPLCGQADGCGGACANSDANNWGAWSTCSAVCGGGTQTRTNACGTIQGQACNTQSCQGPWWQVKDGDITTNEDIISRLPSGEYLNLVGSGGFPGVPVYGGSIGVAPGAISQTLWNANTTTSLPRIFDYSYFENLIPDDIVFNDISKLTTGVGVTTDASGYEWYKITGNLDTVGNIDFGSRSSVISFL